MHCGTAVQRKNYSQHVGLRGLPNQFWQQNFPLNFLFTHTVVDAIFPLLLQFAPTTEAYKHMSVDLKEFSRAESLFDLVHHQFVITNIFVI